MLAALFGYWELLCMILFVVGIVWTIADLVKKKYNRKSVILLAGSAVLFLVLAFGSAFLALSGVNF